MGLSGELADGTPLIAVWVYIVRSMDVIGPISTQTARDSQWLPSLIGWIVVQT